MNTQLKFEVVLRAPLGELYNDVIYLSFIRAPIVKQSSFAKLKINLPPILIQQISNDLSNNLYQDFKIEIYIIDEQNKNKPVTLIFSKLYKILFAKPLEPITFDKQVYPCQLILANPFIHYMSTTNTYNVILENKTGYEAIKDYEEFIAKTHGNIFKFRHVGTDSEVNEYKYEQILVKTPNDISVPTYLINTYKPFHTFSFYFFDDFYISSDSDNEITCHYLNLFEKNQIEQFDILESGPDVVFTIKKLEQYPLSDQFLDLDKTDQTFTVTNREILYHTEKSIKSNIITHQSPSVLNEALADNRDTQIVDATDPLQRDEIKQSTQHVNIYSPDDIESTKKRFIDLKDFFMTKVDVSQVFEIAHCLPDWCQFGKLYNMDANENEQDLFLYTPLSIVNIFHRNNVKEHYCSHMVKTNMLKFIDEDIDEYSYSATLKYVKQQS